MRNTAEPPPPFQPSEPLAEADAAQLSRILARHEGQLGNLLPVLQEINQTYGYLPRVMLEHLACLWGLRLAEVLRVASFYDRFHLEPTGRHVVEVCAGTSCHARSSRSLLEKLEAEIGVEAGQTDSSGRFTLRTVRCLGLCALSPALKIDGQAFGRVNLDRVPEILEQFA
ncbi:MAG: NAD(P)H-dependent oxidoreductase subunit E [Planctomycetota bacterium]|nr:NAD(P)H-dependent oxidoreductase subunit E [Planctomycetota bacterium]